MKHNSSESNKSFSTSEYSIQPLEGRGFNLNEPTTNATDFKVFFGNKISAKLKHTLDVYAIDNNLQINYVLEQALSEYFVNHRQDFSTNNSLTIAIEQQPRLRKAVKADVIKCQVKEQGKPCSNEAVGKAEWLQGKRTLNVCQEHLTECIAKPKEWKVLAWKKPFANLASL